MALAAACGGDGDDGGSGLAGAPPDSELSAAAQAGRDLAEAEGCTSCHTADGDPSTGPTWEGIWGSEVELEDGGTVVVDRAYVERSVTDPDADVVTGYDSLMPTFDLTAAEIDDLVAYLEALG